jgi:hypothetical protein
MAIDQRSDTPSPMSGCELDHLVVTAADLRSGVEWVRDVLGAEPRPGGKHREMGTHNCLLRLGESAYLEVIAPDPGGCRPEWPRWFDLDRLERNAPPRLAGWVARAADIRAAHVACSESLGDIERMSRDDLEWLITVPGDGSLPLDGAGPMLIEWPAHAHPVSRLPESGCMLLRLEGFHPDPDRVARMLRSVEFAGAVSISRLPAIARPHLVAHIQTADGVKTLGNA